MPRNYNLFLKGEVGNRWLSNFTSDMVNQILDKYKDSQVNVLINSLGGYTHEGLTISSLFKIHGDVHVHFIGQSASAATIAAMGAKKISIDADAMFLVHRCASPVFEWAMMNTEQIDEFIEKLEKQKEQQSTIDNVVANLYARRCKKSREELLSLMSKDTWLTAQEALEWGFVDEITNEDDDKEPLTDETASAISSAGLPLPPGYKVRKDSLISSFVNAFCSLIRQDSHRPTPAHIPSDNSKTITQNNMNDPVTPPAPEQAPDTVSTEEPAVSDKDSTIESLRSQLADRDRTIAELKKAPAAPTSSVTDSRGSDEDITDPYAPVSHADAIAASKTFLEKFS